MDACAGSPLYLKSAEDLSAHGPLVLTLVEADRYAPPYGLRRAVAELRRRCPRLCVAPEQPPEPEDPWAWAQREQAAGRQSALSADELAAARCCAHEAPDFFHHASQALFEWKPGGVADDFLPWEVFLGSALSGLRKIRAAGGASSSSCSGERPQRLERAAWLPEVALEQLRGQVGREVCFTGFQRVAPTAPAAWASRQPEGGGVPCLLEFDSALAAQAADVTCLLDDASEAEFFLLPYLRCQVTEVSVDCLCEDVLGMQAYRVRLGGPRRPGPLTAVAADAPPESTLAGALLVGLHTSRPGEPSALLAAFLECFRLLTEVVTLRSSECVGIVWKSYWECLFQDLQAPKKLSERNFSGVFDVARVAVMDSIRAAQGVTKRFWGSESCVNQRAMDEERSRRAELLDQSKREAVDVARKGVLGLGLETLTDPESFLKFLHLDPVQALGTVPAATQMYLESGPAQRVLIFAKLLGLVAVAGGLLRGDERIGAALRSPFAASGAEVPEEAEERMAALASDLVALQRAHLARCRLLVVAGAPDAGKTTLLREAYGLSHLSAGLSPEARTEQVGFELHPGANNLSCPVYLVDTPGIGDGDQLHRNDMARVLLGAAGWLPGGVVVAWVLRAGRHERREADGLVRQMLASGAKVRVVITHVDRLFEERYREQGPQWKEGELQGVPHKDPRWSERRRALMSELREEVEAPIRAVVGGPAELAYACLGGWMVCGNGAEEDDEFAQQPPWPWARQEIAEFFQVLDREGARKWLGTALAF